ncbi:50S ribosomal protein L23 [Candidatus Parcubacteria bacterium]|nr:50S ribosomal protein L23 [Candidatus Parcubacteria bacterium]
MALFNSKQKNAQPAAKKSEKKVSLRKAASEKALADTRLENTLLHPWMSEKALIGTEKGVYVFAVPPDATKTQVAQAVERLYKVVPVKVNVANLPGKMKPLRGKRGRGTRARRHKAYVYLKKGETITF